MPTTEALVRALLGRKREQTWEGEIAGYTVNFLARQHWKITRTTPWEDAMQEAYVVFLRCKQRYPDVEARHFMALYKTSLGRHFINLANNATKDRCLTPLSEGAMGVVIDPVGATDNDGALATAIRQAPDEVRMVLSLLLNAPQHMMVSLLGGWSGAVVLQ